MARILISRTPQEWRLLTKQTNKTGVPSLVRRSIQTFIQEMQKHPEKIKEIQCKREKKEFLLPEAEFHELQKLSIIMKVPVCTIVDELIISPLLIAK